MATTAAAYACVSMKLFLETPGEAGTAAAQDVYASRLGLCGAHRPVARPVACLTV
jgi:hypothetical protein